MAWRVHYWAMGVLATARVQGFANQISYVMVKCSSPKIANKIHAAAVCAATVNERPPTHGTENTLLGCCSLRYCWLVAARACGAGRPGAHGRCGKHASRRPTETPHAAAPLLLDAPASAGWVQARACRVHSSAALRHLPARRPRLGKRAQRHQGCSPVRKSVSVQGDSSTMSSLMFTCASASDCEGRGAQGALLSVRGS